MKKTALFAFALPTLAFALPVLASAASVQVMPTIVNAHGGTKYAADIYVCAVINGQKKCETGVPTFDIPAGATYGILFSPPAGYSYASHGDCDGTPASDASLICYVDYKDGVVIPPVSPLALPAPAASSPAGSASTQTPPAIAPSASQDDSATIIELQQQLISLLFQFIAKLQSQLAATR